MRCASEIEKAVFLLVWCYYAYNKAICKISKVFTYHKHLSFYVVLKSYILSNATSFIMLRHQRNHHQIPPTTEKLSCLNFQPFVQCTHTENKLWNVSWPHFQLTYVLQAVGAKYIFLFMCSPGTNLGTAIVLKSYSLIICEVFNS